MAFKIVVCVKQVPDTTEVKIDPVTRTLVREGVPAIINPPDTYALEEALRLKARFGGTVTALSMGPMQAEKALRECLALGADEAVLLSDRMFAGADTLATAKTLAAAIARIRPDIVFCGKQAIDGDTGQVGPGIAEELGIPHVTYVRKLEVEGSRVTVERLVEGGYEVVRTSLPALFTVLKEINVPRVPSLRGKLRAQTAPITVLTGKDLGLSPEEVGLRGSATEVIRVFPPLSRVSGEPFSGDPELAAKHLAEKLRKVLAL